MMSSVAGLLVVWSTVAGLGVPLGVPPGPENPAMQQVAPEECLVYSTWTAPVAPDPNSSNHTEQLLAEPEVRAFVQSLENVLSTSLSGYAAQAEDGTGKKLARVTPLWIKSLTTKSTALFVSRLEMTDPDTLAFEGGLLIEAGPEALELAGGLSALITSEDLKPTAVTIGKSTFQRFHIEERGLAPTEVTIGAAGPYLLVGIGKQSVESMFERLRAKQVPAWLTTLQKRLPVERRASMSYVNLPELVNGFLPLAGPNGARIAESLGLKQLRAMETVTGLDKEGLYTRTFLGIEGQPTGLLTLFGGDAISADHIAFVPKDSTFATAFSFKTQHVYNLARHLIADNVPDGAAQFDQIAQQFQEVAGQRLEEDVLASLGDVWTLSASPADGWLGVVATVQVRDRVKLEALVKRAQGMLADTPPEQRLPQIEAKAFGDHSIYMVAAPGFPLRPAWCLTDDRLIIGISPQVIRSILSAKPQETGLFAQPAVAAAVQQGDGKTIAVSYQDTAKTFEATYGYVTLFVPMMLEAMNEANRRQGNAEAEYAFDMSMIPSARAIHRHLRPGIAVTKRTAEGIETQSHQTFPMPSIGTSAPVAVALLLPAVQASREAARRMQSSNNLKQITLALHNYHDTYRNFPPAYSVDKAGKPLLSWRVHILPFIEEQALYNQFRLDEPWDSEHNKALIAKMPKVYRSPNSTAAPGKTNYLGVSGAGSIFDKPAIDGNGQARGIGIASITDGTSNTAIVVETNDTLAVEWTKPADFVPVEKDPIQGLSGLRAGGFMAALADGSVRFISDKIDSNVLLNFFKRADGNVVQLEP